MAAAAASSGLAEWAERSARRRTCTAAGDRAPGWLRFAFYGRVSTEDWQDPVMSRARQREQAGSLVRGRGQIVAEFFDVGLTRKLAWACRPQSAALVAPLTNGTSTGHKLVVCVRGPSAPNSRYGTPILTSEFAI